MTFEMVTAVDFGIISHQETDDKYLTFIMTQFLLIMPYQWYSIIKANMMGRLLMRTTLTILRNGVLFCAMWRPAIFYFATYVEILRESRQNASKKQHCKHTSNVLSMTYTDSTRNIGKKRTAATKNSPITGVWVHFLKSHIIADVKGYLNKHI